VQAEAEKIRIFEYALARDREGCRPGVAIHGSSKDAGCHHHLSAERWRTSRQTVAGSGRERANGGHSATYPAIHHCEPAQQESGAVSGQ
jgi:hypothetical protein